MISKEETIFNEALGLRIRQQRQLMKWSQMRLGACIGVTGGQMRKYESGENRVPADKLARCAKALNVSISYLCGEGEDGEPPRFDKTDLIIAAEIKKLPSDKVRKGAYYFLRSINEDLTAIKDKGREEHAA